MQCVVHHNQHGVVPIHDQSIAGLIGQKLAETLDKVNDINGHIASRLDFVSNLHQQVTQKMSDIIFAVKHSMKEAREMLDQREAEIVEEVYGKYKPITSKLETFASQYQIAFDFNKKEKDFIEYLRD